MLAPVVSTIEVPCSQEMAFQIFSEGMGKWWPLDKRAMSMHEGKKAKELRVEAKLGGTIIEIGEDGTEYHWGTFKSYNPFNDLAMDFHMGLPADQASLVEVTFETLADDKTKVVLTQSRWEAFGDMAQMMRDGYGSSWSLIFEEGYGGACRG